MGCSNLWARLKIMCHVRQPIYHTRYSLPLRVATRFNGVAVKSKRNKSESPAVSRSFVSILFLVRFPPHSCPPLQRKIEAIIPARISSYPFENSFYEKPSLFVLRCVFLLFIAGTCEMPGDLSKKDVQKDDYILSKILKLFVSYKKKRKRNASHVEDCFFFNEYFLLRKIVSRVSSSLGSGEKLGRVGVSKIREKISIYIFPAAFNCSL